MAQGTRPKNRPEFMASLKEPYVKSGTDPRVVFSQPKKAGQPEINRSLQVSMDNDSDKDFYIGIKDVDEAVMHYFKNVLKLYVIQNNSRVEVPILYGTPESWNSFQKDGYYRDKEGKLLAPMLVFKKDSITQNRNLGYKLDGNHANNLQFFEKKYSNRNFYSNFSVLNNRSEEREFIATVIPDYITVEYNCVVWTYFMEQMDKILETLNYASRSYWGDPNRFQFYSSIETFNDTTIYEQGQDRAVRTNFNLTVNGYLIPDSLGKQLSFNNKVYGTSKVVFGIETTDSPIETYTTSKKPIGKTLGSVITADSINVINQTINNVPSEAINYINTNKELTGTVTNQTTVTFAAGWLPAPSSMPATSIDNFTFFCNGQLIEKSAITSFSYSGSVSTLAVNPQLLSYSLESDDEVVGIGKFNI